MIQEEGGKSISAISLFAIVFKYLRGHFMNTLEESARYGAIDTPGKHFNVRYVVTVPVKWDNASRESVKSAAKKVTVVLVKGARAQKIGLKSTYL